MKALLWVATIVWFLLSWWWYVCPHKKVCPFGKYAQGEISMVERENPADRSDGVTSRDEEESNGLEATDGASLEATLERLDPAMLSRFRHGYPLFHWSSASPTTSAAFPAFRDSLLGTLEDADLLEIVADYFSDETNESSFADLGLARANALRQLFPNLPDTRIQLGSNLATQAADKARSGPFLAARFRRIVNNEDIKEIAGRTVINFPHASDEMHENPRVNRYLDDLVERLKRTEEKVQLVGHTDDSASAERNMRLGMMRANAIKDILVAKGLSASRILVQSKGEDEPIASNKTGEGRRQNRRVEITIIS